MKLKTGSFVLLPNGKPGVIAGIGGQATSSFVMPDGTVDKAKDIPLGFVSCHEMDENGEDVMEKHPKYMRFITKAVVIPIHELKDCPADIIPASRRRSA